jgi:hypothetical protein
MWEPLPLTTLWASTACYRDSFTSPPPYSCYLLHAGFLLGLFVDIVNGAACSSEMSFDLQRTTVRYVPEDKILYSQRCRKQTVL